MYEYKFIVVKLRWFSSEPEIDYHEIVREQAEQGWRLVQIFAPSNMARKAPSYFELIFEKKTA